MHRIFAASLFVAPAAFAAGACFDSAHDCAQDKAACVGNGGAASTATSTSTPMASTGTQAGTGGTGGMAPCGGPCQDPTPLCSKPLNKCVACLADADCKDAAAAECDKGACIPCTASDQCKTHVGATSATRASASSANSAKRRRAPEARPATSSRKSASRLLQARSSKARDPGHQTSDRVDSRFRSSRSNSCGTSIGDSRSTGMRPTVTRPLA